MISSGEIRLKERTRKKAAKQIDGMLGDSLKEDLSRYSDAELAVRDAQRQVSNHELLDELSDTEESLEEEMRTIERLRDHVEESERKIESLSEEIRETKPLLEERLNSMFEAEVTVYGFPEPLEKTTGTPSAEDNGEEGR
jgi:peptidoglycan hydrolase CwlO-like protein